GQRGARARMKVFLSPHNDDETLFGAFTIIREKPLVVIVYDSYVQPNRGQIKATAGARRSESVRALKVLGAAPPALLGLRDDSEDGDALRAALQPFGGAQVWAPAVEEEGNRHHNLVGEAAAMLFGSSVCHYMTYTSRGKSVGSRRVIPHWSWIPLKLRGLGCYQTQLEIPQTRPYFLDSQEEYYL